MRSIDRSVSSAASEAHADVVGREHRTCRLADHASHACCHSGQVATHELPRLLHQPRARRGRAKRHLRQEWRVPEAAGATSMFDSVAHMCCSARWYLLPAGRAHPGVVVQGPDNRDAAGPGHRRKVQRQVEQVVDVQHVRPERVQHLSELLADERRPVRVREDQRPIQLFVISTTGTPSCTRQVRWPFGNPGAYSAHTTVTSCRSDKARHN